jgi:hypothetical protein
MISVSKNMSQPLRGLSGISVFMGRPDKPGDDDQEGGD